MTPTDLQRTDQQFPGAGVAEMGEGGEKVELPVINPGDIMFSTVNTVTNTVLQM